MEIPYPECEMAMNTEGGHVVDSVSRIRNGYEYRRPYPARDSGYLSLFMITS